MKEKLVSVHLIEQLFMKIRYFLLLTNLANKSANKISNRKFRKVLWKYFKAKIKEIIEKFIYFNFRCNLGEWSVNALVDYFFLIFVLNQIQKGISGLFLCCPGFFLFILQIQKWERSLTRNDYY